MAMAGLDPGAEDDKDSLADRRLEVREGRVVDHTGAGVVRWARRVPARQVRNMILGHGRPYRAADRTPETGAAIRSLGRGD